MNEPSLERLAEGALPGAEFRALADAMPQLVWTARSDGSLEYFNRRWTEYSGLTLEKVLEIGPDVGVVHPHDVSETWSRWKAAIATATPYEMEYRLRSATDDTYRWFLSRAAPIFDRDGSVLRWIGTATDIDEQRRARDSLAFIVDASHVLASAPDVGTICRALADVTVGDFADWCFVVLSQEGRTFTGAMAHKDRELVHYLEQFRDRYPIRPDEPMARVISENTPLLIERILPKQLEEAARDPLHLKLLRLLRMHSVMLIPLSTPAGKVYGALALVSAESRRVFTPVDLDVAMSVCGRAAIAIEKAQMLETERLTSQRLRFTGRANELLLDTSDFWKAMRHIAEMIAEDVSDGCVVVRLAGDAVRVEVAVDRDAGVNAAVGRLEGKRPFKLDAERNFAARLRRATRSSGDHILMPANAWPYLFPEFAAFDNRSMVVLALKSGETTYGALIATYSEGRYAPERDLPLLEEIAVRASIVAAKADTLERERRIATTLQQASLPTLIPQVGGMHLDAVYAPAGDEAEVGGDWYDAIELDDGSVVVSVGDVTGRGIQAAAIMSKVRHAMGMAPRHEPDPKAILDSAEWFLRKRYPDAIVTAFVAVISSDRRTLRFANAGHPSPILRRAGNLTELEATGLPLGLRYLATSEDSRSLELQDGDLLALFTDGLIEWDRDLAGGQQRLEDILKTRAIVASTAAAHLVERACLPGKTRDDVAILTLSIGAVPAWSFSVEDPRAAADARGLFVEFLSSRIQDEARLLKAELIFGELLGNVVRYAPGPVEINLFCDDNKARLHVIDSGPPFELSNRLPKSSLSEFGRGLFIVQNIGQDLTVEQIPNGGNHTSVGL